MKLKATIHRSREIEDPFLSITLYAPPLNASVMCPWHLPNLLQLEADLCEAIEIVRTAIDAQKIPAGLK